MTEIVFIANAAVSLIIAGLCLYHAFPNRDRLVFFVAATIYSVLLEQLVILQFDVYRYPIENFLLTVGDVPIVIALAWAAIMYSGLHAARSLGFSEFSLPFFAGLYALHIDVAIDPIAVRIPFWTWALSGEWFEVPLGNFFGWFLVVTLFTGFWVGLDEKISSRIALSVVTASSSLVSLLLLLWAFVGVFEIPFSEITILGGVILGSGLILARQRPRVRPIPAVLAAVPLLFNGFYLTVLLSFGMYVEDPLLLMVSLSMILVWAVIYAVSSIMRSRISK